MGSGVGGKSGEQKEGKERELGLIRKIKKGKRKCTFHQSKTKF